MMDEKMNVELKNDELKNDEMMNEELNDKEMDKNGKRKASYDDENPFEKESSGKKHKLEELDIYGDELFLLDSISDSIPQSNVLNNPQWIDGRRDPLPTQTWFTMHNNASQLCIVFIKNPSAFKDMFVVIRSCPKRNPIIIDCNKPNTESNVIVFRCADCQQPEHARPQYGDAKWLLQALPMYGIVVDGQPIQVCVNCLHAYNAKGLYSYDHENDFFKALYNPENASVRTVNQYDKNAVHAEAFIPWRINFQYSSENKTSH